LHLQSFDFGFVMGSGIHNNFKVLRSSFSDEVIDFFFQFTYSYNRKEYRKVKEKLKLSL
jgi:hypothetical protein